jgi:hypothetical protein
MTDKNTLADNNIKDFDEPSRYVLDNHKVGQLGWIALGVCSNCVWKLDENDDGKPLGMADLKQKVIRNEEDKRRYKEMIEG